MRVIPRGRGTLVRLRAGAPRRRVIPAGAGNARARPRATLPPAGHPRGGGERGRVDVELEQDVGSSPRGRGTRGGVGSVIRRLRVIPAGAGNAFRSTPAGRGRPGHPRGGGERAPFSLTVMPSCGSSPRGRGTHGKARVGRLVDRVIPAGAGNAPIPLVSSPLPPGHPRGGGERLVPFVIGLIGSGSSPRGRGTPPLRLRGRDQRRVIPAGAGNARRPLASVGAGAGHPRGGGERSSRIVRMRSICGSSPRGRGTRPARLSRAR